MKALEFRPKLLDTLRNYTRKSFMTDLMAGVIVGIVALPLAIAFGIASGVTPEKGIITAIVAGLIISVLGGSKVQIGGPTGAFIIIINAPVGPPICTLLPPNTDIISPDTMAVIIPFSGVTPEAIPKAMASGRATIPTITPAIRSVIKLFRL